MAGEPPPRSFPSPTEALETGAAAPSLLLVTSNHREFSLINMFAHADSGTLTVTITPTPTGTSAPTFTRTNAGIILGSAVGAILLALVTFLLLWFYCRRRRSIVVVDVERRITLQQPIDLRSPIQTARSSFSRYSGKPDFGSHTTGAPKMLANHSVQAIIPIMIVNHPYSQRTEVEQDITDIAPSSVSTSRPFSLPETIRSPSYLGSPRASSTLSRQELSIHSPIQSKGTLKPPVEEVVIPDPFSDEESSFKSPVSNAKFPFPLPPPNAADRVRVELLRTLDVRRPVLVSGNAGLRSSITPEVMRAETRVFSNNIDSKDI